MFSVLAASNVPTTMGGKTVVFNLNNQSEQIYTYYDTEGNKITMGIKPDDNSTRSSEPWSEGTWDIYLYGPLSAFYKIDISASGKITNAYDENYTAIGLSVKSDTLKFTSSYRPRSIARVIRSIRIFDCKDKWRKSSCNKYHLLN